MSKPELAVSATPLLFGEWPADTVLEHRVKEYVHTGKIALKDKERCDAIMEDWFRLPVEAICRKYAVSDGTVKAIVEAYRGAGKLGEFKERSARRLGGIIELCEQRLIEKLYNDEVPPNVLSITLGIAHDKKGQLEAGIVPGTSRTQEEVGLERYKAMLEAVRERQRQATEGQSEGKGPLAGVSGASGVLETAQETLDQAPKRGADPGPAGPVAGPVPAAPEAGGGVADAAGGRETGSLGFEMGKEQKDV